MSTKIGYDQLQSGTDPYDVLVLDSTGKYPPADGSQIFNVDYNNIINHPDVSSEAVQDIVGGMVDGNVESGGISVEYDDVNGKLNFVREPEFTVEDTFSGGGSLFTLTQTPASDTNVLVIVDGVLQGADSYNIAGNQLTLTESAIDNVIVRHVGVPYTYGTVAPDSIGYTEMKSPYNHKNFIINGDMSIWQRGSLFTGGSQYTADRWQVNSVDADTFKDTVEKPAGALQSLRVEGQNQQYSLRQGIEQFHLFTLNSNWTISFWIKSSVASTGHFIWNFTDDTASFGNLQADPTAGGLSFDVTTSWTRVVIPFTVTTSIPVGTNQFLALIAPQGTSSTNAITNITNIQLEQGSEVTDFEIVDPATQTMRCQRYYWTMDNSFTNYWLTNGIRFDTGRQCRAHLLFPVKMRVGPTVTVSEINYQWGGSSFLGTTVFVDGQSQTGCNARFTASNITDSDGISVAWRPNNLTADAEF